MIIRILGNSGLSILLAFFLLYKFFKLQDINIFEFVKNKKIKEIIKSDLINNNKLIFIPFAIFLSVYILKILGVSRYFPAIHLISSFSFILFLIKTVPSFTVKMKIILTIIGAILGLPLSYYFQSDMLHMMVGGISGYIEKFGDVLDESELIGNVIISVVVFAVIGFFVGNYLDKNCNRKQI